MKIVCGSCGAKYSIADEKVQGKVFKIRCKKCSNVIVVKGSSEESDFGGGGSAAEWFVVINGDQVGPITSVEVDSYFMSGQIDATTYIWKDGMGDWIHLADIPDFAHLAASDMGGVAGGAGPDEATNVVDASHYQRNQSSADENPTVAESVSSDFGYASADPYAAAESSAASETDSDYAGSDYGADYGNSFSDSYSSEGAEYGYAASSVAESSDYGGASDFGSGLGVSGGDSGGGLFSAFDSAPSGGGGNEFMSFQSEAAAPALGTNGHGHTNGTNGSADESLIGKRNENSVLFSLSSLDQVKAVSEPAPAATGPSGVVEGSGLIDIQALATAHKSMSGVADPASLAPQIDAFQHSTMAMPALAPMGSHRSNKPLIIGAVVAGLLLLVLMGTVIALLMKDDGPQQPQIVEKIIVEKAVPTPVAQDEEEIKKLTAEEIEAQKAVAAVEKNEPPTEEKSTKKKDDKGSNVAASVKKDTKKDTSTKKEPKKTKKKDDVDNLLDGLDKKKDDRKTETKKETKKKSSGKSKLSKSDVQGTIKRYSGRVANCAKTSNKKKLSGTIRMKFFIKPNGRVTGASVKSGTFKGTDVGRCVQKVVSGMKFPSTDASANLPVTYPFVVR